MPPVESGLPPAVPSSFKKIPPDAIVPSTIPAWATSVYVESSSDSSNETSKNTEPDNVSPSAPTSTRIVALS